MTAGGGGEAMVNDIIKTLPWTLKLQLTAMLATRYLEIDVRDLGEVAEG